MKKSGNKSSLEELVLRIKEIPISQILGQYITLHRRGSNTLAVCPFHDDHEPSMHINDDRNMFMCFVDNIGGDAISFVRRYKKFEFKEALQDICRVLGWPFDDYTGEKKSPKWELGLKVLNKACQIYFKLGQTQQSPAFQHFVQTRQLQLETVQRYHLGFAPASNVLINYLSSIPNEEERSEAIKVADELGLIKPDLHRAGSHYDYFRDRIMFPIWDQFGQVIGFTSRATTDNQRAKYMNSKDSFLFNKKRILYGLHLAKNAIRDRDQVILVEGNMDQIALSQYGFENSVAIMGVAMGTESFDRLVPLTKHFYLALDNDNAGKEAADRVNQMCLEHTIIPYYVDLGEFKDPDELLKQEGRLAFQTRLDNARPYLDIKLEQMVPKPLPELSDRKLEILAQVFELLRPLKDHIAALERVGWMGKALGLSLSSDQLVQKYLESLVENRSQAPGQKPELNWAKPVSLPKPTKPTIATAPQMPANAPVMLAEEKRQLNPSERLLIQELLVNFSLLTHGKIEELLDFVHQNEVKWFVLKLRKLAYEVDDSQWVSMVESILGQEDLEVQGNMPLEMREAVGAILFNIKGRTKPRPLNNQQLDRLFKGLYFKLREHSLKEKRKEIKFKQKFCTTKEESLELLREMVNVDKQLNQLRYQKKARSFGEPLDV